MTAQPAARTQPRRLLLATDGSKRSHRALAAGLRLVDPSSRSLLVTVTPATDPSIVVGGGHAGPVMTSAEKQELLDDRDRAASQAIAEARAFLGIGKIDAEILIGDPGDAICERAAAGDIDAIVMGTSGIGGLKRALLGSVSDYVVRNAPCPVLTVGDD